MGRRYMNTEQVLKQIQYIFNCLSTNSVMSKKSSMKQTIKHKRNVCFFGSPCSLRVNSVFLVCRCVLVCNCKMTQLNYFYANHKLPPKMQRPTYYTLLDIVSWTDEDCNVSTVVIQCAFVGIIVLVLVATTKLNTNLHKP